MEKLKIGLVIDDSLDRHDGVQQYVHTLGDWLTAQDHEVHYLAGQTTETDNRVHSLARNIDVRFNHNRLSIPLPANSRRIRRVLDETDFDILHVQTPYSPVLSGKIIKAASPETAVVGTFHILPFGRMHRLGSRVLGSINGRTRNRFDAFCSVSEPARDFAKNQFGIDSEVIPCMIDTAKYASEIEPRSGRIVFLGRLVERKGCRQLLESLALLPTGLRSDVEVIVAGDGPEKPSLMSLAKQHNLQVAFKGFIPEDEKASLLASAELAVFPALGGESFGIVLLEAMAAGAGVVIGGDNPGYSSVLANWREALVDAKDTEALANALELFLTDRSLRLRVGLEQHEAVKKYDIQTVGSQIIKMYEAALLHRRQEMR